MLPALDGLPSGERDVIIQVLQQARDSAVQMAADLSRINYDGHKESLEDGLKTFLRRVEIDPMHDWDIQSEQMDEICQEIPDLLPLLWKTAVEDDLAIDLVRQCLVLCEQIYQKLDSSNCPSVTPFFSMSQSISPYLLRIRILVCQRPLSLTIIDSGENVVYEMGYDIHQALVWMWREILVAAYSRGYPVEAIKSDVAHLELTKAVSDLLPIGDL